MDNSDLQQLLLECEAAVSVLSEPMRPPAMQALVTHKLRTGPTSGERESRPATSTDRREGIADLFRVARNIGEKIIVATYAADEDEAGVTLANIRGTLTRCRQTQPGNLPRDVGRLVRNGFLLSLSGSGRDAAYGLSQKGFDVIAQLTQMVQ